MMVLSRRPTTCLALLLLAYCVCLAVPLAAQDQKKDPVNKDDKKADVKKDDKKVDDKKKVDKKVDDKKKVDKKKDDKKVEPKKEEPAKPDLTKEKRDTPLQEFKHPRWVCSLQLSADGKQLLSASRERTVKVWDIASGKDLQTFKDNPTDTRAAVFLPGNRVAAGTGKFSKEKKAWEGEIRIWDLSGKLVQSLKGHTAEIECLAVSKDGKLLASGSEDHTIIIWDLASGKDIRTIKAHSKTVWSVAFSPEGRLASAGEDGFVRVWDPTAKQPAKKEEPKKDEPKKDEPKKAEPKKAAAAEAGINNGVTLAQSVSEGPLTVAAKKDKKDKVADKKKEEPAEKLDTPLMEFKGPGRDFSCVSYSPDGKLLVAGNLEPVVMVWDSASGKELAVLKTVEGVRSIAFSPDGNKIAAGCWDHAIRIYEARTGKQLQLIHAHQGTPISMVFVSETQLASGGTDDMIKIWDLTKIQRTGLEPPPPPPPAK